ncbi:c-type cytochrome [Marivita hallyeonensis]|uniref:Cytochrome c556 n=1 Tax=Marivita hallyeonensis TaxID=996342 RepID=A0A1M5TB51_9RHOB|nr:cytochrome c [Marivita hallyeonensis]SHH48015.1 Cytochrome c556 [Marivita hallyeonensis]
MQHSLIGAIAVSLFASLAYAHSGVTNPAVQARMDLMVGVKDATAVIGKMAKQALPFDASAAETARLALIDHATQIPALFEANERDPLDEARDEIWQDWDGFVQKTETMRIAAGSMDTSSLDTLRAGLAPLGASCSGCHEAYRIDK